MHGSMDEGRGGKREDDWITGSMDEGDGGRETAARRLANGFGTGNSPQITQNDAEGQKVGWRVLPPSR